MRFLILFKKYMKLSELIKEINDIDDRVSSIKADIKKEIEKTDCVMVLSLWELKELEARLKRHKSLLRFHDYSCNDPIIQKIDETIKEYESSI